MGSLNCDRTQYNGSLVRLVHLKWMLRFMLQSGLRLMLSVAGRAGLADVIALLCFDVVRLCAICVVRQGGDRRDHTVDQPQ